MNFDQIHTYVGVLTKMRVPKNAMLVLPQINNFDSFLGM